MRLYFIWVYYGGSEFRFQPVGINFNTSCSLKRVGGSLLSLTNLAYCFDRMLFTMSMAEKWEALGLS